MSRVYFQPVGNNSKKYKQCVDRKIKVEDLKDLVNESDYKNIKKIIKDQDLNLWGIQDGKDGRTKRIFNTIQESDWVIFSSKNQFIDAGEIFYKLENEKIANEFLDNSEFKNIYLFKNKKTIKESIKKIVEKFGLKTPKINKSFVIRRFDGLGLNRNPKINQLDIIDNEKLIKFLSGYKNKEPINNVNNPKKSNNDLVQNKNGVKVKTNIQKEKQTKKGEKMENKTKSTTTAKKESVKKPAASVKKEPVKKTANASAKKTVTSEVGTKKKTSTASNKKVDKSKSTTFEQVVASDRPVIKIRPITNLTDSEQKETLNGLYKTAKTQITFADKYYVLENGIVIMIPSSKKEIKEIKKYIKKSNKRR